MGQLGRAAGGLGVRAGASRRRRTQGHRHDSSVPAVLNSVCAAFYRSRKRKSATTCSLMRSISLAPDCNSNSRLRFTLALCSSTKPRSSASNSSLLKISSRLMIAASASSHAATAPMAPQATAIGPPKEQISAPVSAPASDALPLRAALAAAVAVALAAIFGANQHCVASSSPRRAAAPPRRV